MMDGNFAIEKRAKLCCLDDTTEHSENINSIQINTEPNLEGNYAHLTDVCMGK
jgi:hypothetical protein